LAVGEAASQRHPSQAVGRPSLWVSAGLWRASPARNGTMSPCLGSRHSPWAVPTRHSGIEGRARHDTIKSGPPGPVPGPGRAARLDIYIERAGASLTFMRHPPLHPFPLLRMAPADNFRRRQLVLSILDVRTCSLVSTELLGDHVPTFSLPVDPHGAG
jgi:hypothetical protein